jgi:hypothetical protein
MCNQLVSITTNVDLILSIKFQVSCSVPRLMENDPYQKSNTTRHGVNGKRMSLAPFAYVLFKICFHLLFQDIVILLGPIEY